MRTANIRRETKETSIILTLNLDGSGAGVIQTPVGFLNHMLELFAKHSSFDLKVDATGDVHVDFHHLVEDLGICLGKALVEALGDKKGICRYGSSFVPMDEALVLAALDLSGRNAFVSEMSVEKGKIGDFDTELAVEFFRALADNARMNLHLRQFSGDNRHHVIEAAFKACARSLRQAVSLDPRASGVPSTKGTL